MSGRPPGARQPQERWTRVTRMGQSSQQWLGRRNQATGGHPRREDGLLGRNPTLGRCSRLEGRQKGEEMDTLTTSTVGGKREHLEIGFLQRQLTWKRNALFPAISFSGISGLKGTKMMVSSLFFFTWDHKVIISESCELIKFFQTFERFEHSNSPHEVLPSTQGTQSNASAGEALTIELCSINSPAHFTAHPYNTLDACRLEVPLWRRLLIFFFFYLKKMFFLLFGCTVWLVGS